LRTLPSCSRSASSSPRPRQSYASVFSVPVNQSPC
jgi:hypothetical protein